MKSVFKSKEIAHIWANEAAPSGRCPSNMSFEGDAFRSYGTVIARRIRKGGKAAVVLDDCRFSVSTSRHQSYVRLALSGSTAKFSVECGNFGQDLAFTPSTLRDYYLQERSAKREQAKSRYAHIRAHEVDVKAYYLSEAIRVCDYFELPANRLRGLQTKEAEQVKEARRIVEAYAAKREARREVLRQARIQKEIERDKENVPKWINGEHVHLSWNYPCLLRAVNGNMETSKGAIVPIVEAERAYRFAVTVKSRGWHRNGEQFTIGHYNLDSVNENGVVAGCHRVAWSEIERFAVSQGWTQ